MSGRDVLIVDDDAEIQELLTWLISQQGWEARSALTVLEADRLIQSRTPDVVVLDLMLPDASGLDALRRWKSAHPGLPVLMLSARGELGERVQGLEMGADDYLPKPFAAIELVARVRALLRRAPPSELTTEPLDSGTELSFPGLKIDLIRREVLADESSVMLTRVEFRLLVALASRPGETLPREALHAAIQPGKYRPLDRTVDVQVLRVRRKLQTAAPGTEWIRTVRGVGYVFLPGSAPTE